MAGNTSAVNVRLTASTIDYINKLAEADSKTKKHSKKMGDNLSNMGKRTQAVTKQLGGMAKMAGAVVTAALGAMVVELVRADRQLKILAETTNIPIQNLRRMEYALKSVGLTQEQWADQSKDVMDKIGEYASLGTGAMNDFFDVVKGTTLSIQDFQGLAPEEVIQRMKNEMDKFGVSTETQTFVLEAMASELSKTKGLFADNGAELAKLTEKYDQWNTVASFSGGAILDFWYQLKATIRNTMLLVSHYFKQISEWVLAFPGNWALKAIAENFDSLTEFTKETANNLDTIDRLNDDYFNKMVERASTSRDQMLAVQQELQTRYASLMKEAIKDDNEELYEAARKLYEVILTNEKNIKNFKEQTNKTTSQDQITLYKRQYDILKSLGIKNSTVEKQLNDLMYEQKKKQLEHIIQMQNVGADEAKKWLADLEKMKNNMLGQEDKKPKKPKLGDQWGAGDLVDALGGRLDTSNEDQNLTEEEIEKRRQHNAALLQAQIEAEIEKRNEILKNEQITAEQREAIIYASEQRIAAMKAAANEQKIDAESDYVGEAGKLARAAGMDSIKVNQGEAIANASIDMYEAISDASAKGWPASATLIPQIVTSFATIINGIGGITGQFHNGTGYVEGTGSYYLQQGERVVARDQNQDLGKMLNDYNKGGTSIGATVTQTNNYYGSPVMTDEEFQRHASRNANFINQALNKNNRNRGISR